MQSSIIYLFNIFDRNIKVNYVKVMITMYSKEAIVESTILDRHYIIVVTIYNILDSSKRG
jgi:hypothetical protein